jgi:hypothetical protein
MKLYDENKIKNKAKRRFCPRKVEMDNLKKWKTTSKIKWKTTSTKNEKHGRRPTKIK